MKPGTGKFVGRGESGSVTVLANNMFDIYTDHNRPKQTQANYPDSTFFWKQILENP